MGSPSLGYFSWRDKKSNQPPGCPRLCKHQRAAQQNHTAQCASRIDALPRHPNISAKRNKTIRWKNQTFLPDSRRPVVSGIIMPFPQ